MHFKTKESFLENLRTFIESHKELYGDVQILSALVKEGDKWTNALTKIIILQKDEKPSSEKPIIYDIFALTSETITLKELFKRLEGIDKNFKVAEFQISFDTPYVERASSHKIELEYQDYQPSNNEYYDWPGLIYMMTSSSKSPPPYYQPVKYDAPYFRDGYHAVKKWIKLKKFHDNYDARLGKLIFFVPNYKAKIDTINYSEKTIQICINNKIDLDQIQCQIFCSDGINESQQNKNLSSENKINFTLEFEPSEINVRIVTKNNELLDYYIENNFYHSGTTRLINISSQDDTDILIERIQNGENDTTEFKSFINLSDTTKVNELIKTSIAFANTKGGKIIIGVNKYAEIEGIERDLIKFTKNNKTQDNYIKDIKKLILDGMKKQTLMSVYYKELFGRNVIVIEVKEGDTRLKPFCTLDNKIFIRSGATTRMPDPDTELPNLYKNKE